uniref:TAXI family TRAP transporter solute-binding subunit n=1 Tax=Pararhizobium sp. IMCC3301 TaxID=3067904 RepID=UPI0027407E94|nr:TAXI family TRAP transporter solute-binding subunit [Pararhizobium sp. IMCC3301]
MNLLTRLTAAAVITAASGTAALAQKTYISIGSNPIGNTAYQWAAGISDLANRNLENVEFTAEGTKGYLANVALMMDKQIEAGFANSKLAYEAYNALGDFADEEPGQIMSWLSVAPILQHVVVPASSDIQSLEDLRAKRVGIGQPGGTSMLDAEILMGAVGLNPESDFEAFRVPLGQMAQMLGDGQIDALVWNGTHPLPPLLQLQSTSDIRILPIPGDVVDRIQKVSGAYQSGEIPANTYKGHIEAIPSYQLGNVLVVRADVSEDIVYETTKLIMENLDHMAGVHPAWGRVSLNTILTGFEAPLHPGALRYYREAGASGIEEFVTRTSKP